MNYRCPHCQGNGPFHTYAPIPITINAYGHTTLNIDPNTPVDCEPSKYEVCNCPSYDFEANLFEFEYTKAI